MGSILAVGIATVDVVCLVERYPVEDSKSRALGCRHVRGGNAANTLAVLSRLGHEVHWAGTLARDAAAGLIVADFDRLGIGYGASCWHDEGATPTSYVWQSQETGSRTIVHHRDLPEFSSDAFASIDLAGFDWLHWEGRNCEQTQRMLADAHARHPGCPRSLEVEQAREGIEALFPAADLIVCSHDYARSRGYGRDPAGLLASLRRAGTSAELVCTWGDQGAWALPRGRVAAVHCPAVASARLVDTLGAGDTFNAALIDARLAGLDLVAATHAACHLAGHKCGHEGFDFVTAAYAARGRNDTDL